MSFVSISSSVQCRCFPGGGGGLSLIWPIWGCAAGQDMVFVLSVLNRVYNFAESVLNSVHDLCESVLVIKLRGLS